MANKIMDYKTLVRLSGNAIHNKKNRQISLDWLKDNENKPFPVGNGKYSANRKENYGKDNGLQDTGPAQWKRHS